MSDVKSLVKGICAAILSVVTFRVRCDVSLRCDASCDCCFWREKL